MEVTKFSIFQTVHPGHHRYINGFKIMRNSKGCMAINGALFLKFSLNTVIMRRKHMFILEYFGVMKKNKVF